MYSLLTLLGLISLICWLHAFTSDPPADGGVRKAPAIGFAVALAAMLYTHNWAIFFGAATGLAWLLLLWRADAAARRRLLLTALVAYGGALLLYAPWIPNTLYQAAHTGAPWANPPTLAALASVPARLLGEEAELAVLLVAGSGVWALWRGRGAPARAVAALLVIAVGTIVLAWLASQVSPAWANRYLAAGVGPFVLLAAAGFAAAGRLGLAGLAIVAVLWAIDGAPAEKSNVREVTEAIAPSLRPGDLVVATQPEQVPVLHYYLPPGLRYATLTGPVADVGVTDWRDGVARLERTSARRGLGPLLDTVPPGGRVVVVVPQVYFLAQWSAPWTSLVRERSEQWLAFIGADTRFARTDVEPPLPDPRPPNPVRAEVYVRR